MKSLRLSPTTYLLRLETGEDIPASILSYAKRSGLSAATITGLGAVKNPKVGIYNPDSKQYDPQTLDGYFEVLSFTGNLALVDDAPFLHAHVAMSDREMKAYGGHFLGGTCGATFELTVVTYAAKLRRELDEATGLKLLES